MYIIHQCKATDIIPVIQLASKVLSERYDSSLFSYLYENTPWGFYVCKFQNTIIGFIIGIHFQEKTGRILMLGVDKNCRRNGIGNALLNQLLKEFQRRFINRIELEVKTSNKEAFEFYKKNKFTVIEILPSFYQNGEDAFMMARELGHR